MWFGSTVDCMRFFDSANLRFATICSAQNNIKTEFEVKMSQYLKHFSVTPRPDPVNDLPDSIELEIRIDCLQPFERFGTF